MTTWTYDAFSELGSRLDREYPPGEDSREWSNEVHAREKLAEFDLRFEPGRQRAQEAYSGCFPDGVLERDYVLILGTRR